MAFLQESTPIRRYKTIEQRSIDAVIRDIAGLGQYIDAQIAALPPADNLANADLTADALARTYSLNTDDATSSLQFQRNNGNPIIAMEGDGAIGIGQVAVASTKLVVKNDIATTNILNLKDSANNSLATLLNTGSFQTTTGFVRQLSGAGTHKTVMGGALATDLTSVRNSADTLGLFDVDGTGKITVRRNITNGLRTFIGGNNTDNAADSAGYDDFAVVGYNNTQNGIWNIFGTGNTGNLNTTDPNGFIAGSGNTGSSKSWLVIGHDNIGGKISIGKNNYSAGIEQMSMIGESNLTSTTGNGFPNKPVYIIGDHNEIPNNANTGNSVHLGVRTTNGDPYTTVHEDNFLIGTLNTWDASYDMSARGVFYTKNGTAPTSLAADSFGMYSADVVVGNACPHFRTENGSIVKLYTESALTVSDGTLANAVTRISELESRLQAQGLLA